MGAKVSKCIRLYLEEVKVIQDTVAAPRLDAVLGVGFSLSRGKAAELIAAGRVQLNYRDCLKGDKQVDKHSAVVIFIKDWVDAEYASGRVAEIGAAEIYNKVNEFMTMQQ